MGVTSKSIELIESILPVQTVCELGAQNLYDKHYSAPKWAQEWYESKGIEYQCIDINGENDAWMWDLSKKRDPVNEYDLVTDFGTSEHVGRKGTHYERGFYNCLRTKHLLCKDGGIIISENPKTGNWPKHGFQYYTQDFYLDLANSGAIEILDLGETAAMGNTKNGWNIYCVARKIGDFPSFEKFKKFAFKLT